VRMKVFQPYCDRRMEKGCISKAPKCLPLKHTHTCTHTTQHTHKNHTHTTHTAPNTHTETTHTYSTHTTHTHNTHPFLSFWCFPTNSWCIETTGQS
jgi:hypothetical protein